MRVFVVGSQGQLGQTLAETVPAAVDFAGAGLPELDIEDRAALEARFAAEQPGFVVNAAAYTAVDKAESEPDVARRINVDGARNVAQAAREAGARVIHISTDFVFDGSKTEPYTPADTPAPLGVYGQTKLDGDIAACDITDGDAIVIRTAWLYSRFGHNFVKTMLRLMKERDALSIVMLRLMKERDALSIVADQRGTPTWAGSLAEVIWAAIDQDLPGGIYHWTDGGEASWYAFAEEIYREARALGILDRDVTIRPIATAEYPTPARRPAYSVLDCSATVTALGVRQRPWATRLQQMLTEMRD
jgi:dTDP-4-dehydrorhamnose reductase